MLCLTIVNFSTLHQVSYCMQDDGICCAIPMEKLESCLEPSKYPLVLVLHHFFCYDHWLQYVPLIYLHIFLRTVAIQNESSDKLFCFINNVNKMRIYHRLKLDLCCQIYLFSAHKIVMSRIHELGHLRPFSCQKCFSIVMVHITSCIIMALILSVKVVNGQNVQWNIYNAVML